MYGGGRRDDLGGAAAIGGHGDVSKVNAMLRVSHCSSDEQRNILAVPSKDFDKKKLYCYKQQ